MIKNTNIKKAQRIIDEMNFPFKKMDLLSVSDIVCTKRNISIYKYQHPKMEELLVLFEKIINTLVVQHRKDEK